MPVFIFLTFLIAALLWILPSFAFIPGGKLGSRVLGNAKEAMQQEYSEPEITAEDTKQNKELR